MNEETENEISEQEHLKKNSVNKICGKRPLEKNPCSPNNWKNYFEKCPHKDSPVQ